jgi:hypothetical protein
MIVGRLAISKGKPLGGLKECAVEDGGVDLDLEGFKTRSQRLVTRSWAP